MESTVELSQKEKLKKFNEKLLMMKNKNNDKPLINNSLQEFEDENMKNNKK